MSSTTVNAHVFNRQEDNLAHLASAIETIGDRVLKLAGLVKTGSEAEQVLLEKEATDIYSVLHCLGVVADECGSRAAGWRAWADKDDINIICDLRK